MNRAFHAFGVIWLALLALACREARASCGASSCPIDTSVHEEPRGGGLRLDVSLQYINQDQPRVGQRKAAVGEVPNPEHNEIATINRIWNFRADYDIDSRWGVGLQMPLINRSHDHVAVDSGENEHWGFTGAGDLIAQLRFAALPKEGPETPSLVLTAAGKFPTGRTGASNSEEPADITIQPGSGSYDFIGGLIYSQNLGRIRTPSGDHDWLPFFAGASYRKNNPGTRNYRMGDVLQASLGSSYALLRKLELLGQANLIVKRKDEKGDTSEDTSWTGGNFLYLSPGLRWRLMKDLSTYAYVQLPVYQRVNQEQTTSPYNLLLGATYQFGPGGL